MTKLDVGEAAVVAALARTLVLDPCASAALDAAAAHIAAGRGEHLFRALLAARPDDDGDAAVADTMATLESMTDARPAVAGYLMARLFPLAGRRYLHHIADGIDLHMDASASTALADALEGLAAEGVRPLLQKRYREWATTIRRRAASLGAGGEAPVGRR
jgi:hypothetical protein